MGILIVDDSEAMRTSCRALLQTVGYHHVWTAATSAEAFEFLGLGRTGTPVPPVDAILMDIVMPGSSGIDACRLIKADARLHDIPIIMVTAVNEDGDLEAAFAAGAIDYVTKPIKIIELLARLRSALMLKQELDHRRARQLELLELAGKLQTMNQELERLTTQDPLTGVANRRVFDQELPREWARAARSGAVLSAIMVDVDHFKAYNDHYGHLQGDTCLKQIAQALRSVVKRPADTMARYGGEEFSALLPRTDAAGAAAVAEAFHDAVDRLHIEHPAAPEGQITISVGVATLVPGRDGVPEDLLRAADHALYDAKHEGRNRVVVFRDGVGASL